MYKFEENISIEEYDNYYENYSKAPITQDYAWAKVKDNFDNLRCGLYKDNKLIAVALVLIRKLPFNLRLFYIPRGYLIDFSNKDDLKEFTNNIKLLAKKYKAYCIKIDPYISFYEKRYSSDETYNYFSENHDIAFNNLKEIGYKHKGYKKEVSAYFQPRFTMVVPLIDKDNNFVTEDKLLSMMKKNTRNYLGNYQTEKGVFFTESNDINDLDEFVSILNKTESRKKILLRSKAYFIKMMESFKERAILFFGKIDLNKYIEFIDKSLLNETVDKEYYSIQRETAVKLIKEKGNIVTTSASIVLFPKNKTGLKMAEFLYAGNDTSIFPNLKINNGLTFYRILYCLKNKIHYANLGGVDGSLEDSLSIFKSKFNPLVIEFIGEFDLPVNKFIYAFVSTFEGIAKKIYKRLVALKHKSNML